MRFKMRQPDKVLKKSPIRVGLIIDEFFGGAGTAFGGYGFLAREYISKFIPNEDIEVDVLLGKGAKKFFAEEYRVDDVLAYRLPSRKWFAKRWLKKTATDEGQVAVILAGFKALLKRKLLLSSSDLSSNFSSEISFCFFDAFTYF